MCLKSGNCLILRGGSESFYSSTKKIAEIINSSFKKIDVPEGNSSIYSNKR